MSQALCPRPATPSTDDPLDYRIVTSVAAAKGVEPLDLSDRLYDVVDATAISKLFGEETTGVTPVRGSISFRFDGCLVTVDHELSIDVQVSGYAAD